MKKYIQSIMAFIAIVFFASCSSEDNTTLKNESAAKVMTFTATQEGDEQSTRAAISTTDSKVIVWKSGDTMSIFDGTKNNPFTLTEGEGSTSGKFSGEAGQSTSYTAVYPYQANATLSGNDVTNVTLPATQTATANSFDKNAALMMAQSNNTTLKFKNVVGYVKVKPKFDCTRIDLVAFDNSAVLAGTGTVSFNNGVPTINLSNAEKKDYAITLTGEITANNYYYIAVHPVTLKAGWTIKFTAKDNGKVYSRKGTNPITFTRNKVIDLGEFATNGSYWYEPRGKKVNSDQEVDLGLTITIGTKEYKVIFAKSNLTATGLATNEYDYGDYFAWGATEPWYSSATQTWKDGKSEGYTLGNAPHHNGSKYTKYTTDGNTLEAADDAANKILGGDWQLPTKEIWKALYNTSSYRWTWTSKSSKNGMEVQNNSTNKSIFLPAAGSVNETSFNFVDSYGYYWSSTIYPSSNPNPNAYDLYFTNGSVNAQNFNYRYFGVSVRPVRLVAVD